MTKNHENNIGLTGDHPCEPNDKIRCSKCGELVDRFELDPGSPGPIGHQLGCPYVVNAAFMETIYFEEDLPFLDNLFGQLSAWWQTNHPQDQPSPAPKT